MAAPEQVHHILTQANTKNHPVHQSVFAELKAGGHFDWDGPTNTVDLPTDAQRAANLGVPQHFGSHVASYVDGQADIIDEIFLQHQAALNAAPPGHPKRPDALAALGEDLEKASLFVRDKLSYQDDGNGRRTPGVVLHHTDHHSAGDANNHNRGKITYDKFTQWEGYNNAAYRSALKSDTKLFDLTLTKQERLAHRGDLLGQWDANARKYATAYNDSNSKLRKVTGVFNNIDGTVGAFEAMMVGVAAAALIKIASDTGVTLEQLLE